MYDYIIVGSGLYGAIFAHEAMKAGKSCLVVERRSHIGGNIYTKEMEGIQVHQYGAHIFHTSNKEVWDYIGQFATFNRYTNCLQQELIEMLKDYEGTVIMVSHSRDEIYRFSEELLIMDQGKPVIYGETKEIFAKPVYKEAAKLTGCKNFSRIKRVDAHTAEILDWGITLHSFYIKI